MPFPNDGQDPLANHKQYKTKAYLGKGASGFVVQATDKRNNLNEDVAIKLLKRGEITRYVESEIVNHSMLRHPHVVQFKKVFLTQEHICIVMEFASAGSLFHYVQKQGKLKEPVSRFFFQQLMIGVDYCHKRGVANRDIKLENTLLHHMPGWPLPLLKICDFGYSKADHRSAAKTKVGTLTYMAPEVLLNKDQGQYNGKVADIWSCGVMLYVMIYGRYPFDQKGGKPVEIMQMLDKMVNMTIPMPESVVLSTECRNLLLRMLQPEPSRRITLEEILVHPWFLTNLPREAATMNVSYLQNANSLNVETAVDQIKNLLREARGGAGPTDPQDDDMLDADVIETAIKEKTAHEQLSPNLEQYMHNHKGY